MCIDFGWPIVASYLIYIIICVRLYTRQGMVDLVKQTRPTFILLQSFSQVNIGKCMVMHVFDGK